MLLIDESNVGEFIKGQVGRRQLLGDSLVIDFLAQCSSVIFADKALHEYPDIITFAYFCRKSSIMRIVEPRRHGGLRIGWGVSIHIAPSNIPLNFALSLVFGLLSGNSNLVRLPSNHWPQVPLLCDIFQRVAMETKFEDILTGNAFVKTDRNSALLIEAISHCDALIVWGGDETVKAFRSLEKKPRCVELYFPNRESAALMKTQAILDLDQTSLRKVVKKFYNDTYIVDQNACSSPSTIYWIGDDLGYNEARLRFWKAVVETVSENGYELDVVARIDKYLDILKIVGERGSSIHIDQFSRDVWVTTSYNESVTCRYGRFFEINCERLNDAFDLINSDRQTLTYFGYDQSEIKDIILASTLAIDRVVPVGGALDFSVYWDGVDILGRLSRRVDIL